PPDGPAGQLARRVGDLGTTALVHAHGQGHHIVVRREFFGDLQLPDDTAPQPRPAPGPAHPDTHLVHLIAAPPDDVAVEAHQEADLIRAATPVLGGERVSR